MESDANKSVDNVKAPLVRRIIGWILLMTLLPAFLWRWFWPWTETRTDLIILAALLLGLMIGKIAKIF